jgi:hypothetical protein
MKTHQTDGRLDKYSAQGKFVCSDKNTRQKEGAKMTAARKLNEDPEELHAKMTDEEIETAIINGIETGKLLGLDQEKDWPTFSRFAGVYDRISAKLMGGLSAEERDYVLRYITANNLNTVILNQSSKKKKRG